MSKMRKVAANATEVARGAFVLNRMRNGWDVETAGLVALALHPFDLSLPVGRQLTKAVMARSRIFSKAIPDLSQTHALLAARLVLLEYIALSEQIGENRYVSAWSATAERIAARLVETERSEVATDKPLPDEDEELAINIGEDFGLADIADSADIVDSARDLAQWLRDAAAGHELPRREFVRSQILRGAADLLGAHALAEIRGEPFSDFLSCIKWLYANATDIEDPIRLFETKVIEGTADGCLTLDGWIDEVSVISTAEGPTLSAAWVIGAALAWHRPEVLAFDSQLAIDTNVTMTSRDLPSRLTEDAPRQQTTPSEDTSARMVEGFASHLKLKRRELVLKCVVIGAADVLRDQSQSTSLRREPDQVSANYIAELLRSSYPSYSDLTDVEVATIEDLVKSIDSGTSADDVVDWLLANTWTKQLEQHYAALSVEGFRVVMDGGLPSSDQSDAAAQNRDLAHVARVGTVLGAAIALHMPDSLKGFSGFAFLPEDESPR
jgi:hypothetical protein